MIPWPWLIAAGLTGFFAGFCMATYCLFDLKLRADDARDNG